MGDIYERFRENLEEVKRRENEVARREQELQLEAKGLEDKAAALDEARLEFERRIAALEKEKAAMARVPISNEDVIELNVQGEKFCTSRGTLTQFPETRLAYMFNGRWKDKLQKDSAGHIFLDFPPVLFRALLDYLTTRRLTETDQVPFPSVADNQLSTFKLMLNFFEIESAIYSGISCFSQYRKSPFIVIEANGSLATNKSQGMGYVLGQDVYANEIVHFVLEIVALEEPWMFFGVMCEESNENATINDCSFNENSGAFGWADRGGFWKAGKRQPQNECTIPAEILRQGQTVEMILNCASVPNSLLIKVLPEKHGQEISHLPSGQSWRLHVNLVSGGDSVRLIKAGRSTIDNVVSS